jgi:hypothetical protein
VKIIKCLFYASKFCGLLHGHNNGKCYPQALMLPHTLPPFFCVIQFFHPFGIFQGLILHDTGPQRFIVHEFLELPEHTGKEQST